MNCIYLVDYSNVGEKGLCGIDELHETDRVCIFYNDIHAKASVDSLCALKRTKAEIKLIDTGFFGGMAETQIASAFGQYLFSDGVEAVFVVTNRRTLDSLCSTSDKPHNKYASAGSISSCSVPKDAQPSDGE